MLIYLSTHVNTTSTEPLPDECQAEATDRESYNTGLHIASVFIILAASTAGVFMPVIASKFRSLRLSARILTLGKQFGTGVILATGFIHMLPTAMSNLSSPCLGKVWSEQYTAFGGLFILISSLFMHWIEFIAVEHNERRMREAAAIQGIQEVDMDLGGLGATGVAAAPCPGHIVTIVEDRPCHDSISTYILEAGIAAHSVIIGVSLGVSSGAEFTGLLIALIFHQFFEGFALGARIADLSFDTTYTHYLLAFIFSLTTPTGAAIGIGISNTYSPNSKTSLLVEGIFDSVSTGILLYMGYVNLLAIEFNLNGEIRKESKKMKSLCFIALWAGALVMAIVGRFA
ncbi:high-affinity Zn(2+) transporter zrt1 [Haplosporangium bisporale]|nr:high-affinity Zn(2+) transporter zrt1 [Haplosporangium bisporale]